VVEPERMQASEARIPFGRLCGENRYQPLADGKIRVGKRVEAHGPFGSLLYLIWENKDAHRHAQELRRAGGAREAAWLSRGARASWPVRSVEMSRPTVPNRADR